MCNVPEPSASMTSKRFARSGGRSNSSIKVCTPWSWITWLVSKHHGHTFSIYSIQPSPSGVDGWLRKNPTVKTSQSIKENAQIGLNPACRTFGNCLMAGKTYPPFGPEKPAQRPGALLDLWPCEMPLTPHTPPLECSAFQTSAQGLPKVCDVSNIHKLKTSISVSSTWSHSRMAAHKRLHQWMRGVSRSRSHALDDTPICRGVMHPNQPSIFRIVQDPRIRRLRLDLLERGTCHKADNLDFAGCSTPVAGVSLGRLLFVWAPTSSFSSSWPRALTVTWTVTEVCP